jgi:hypothetical protein
MNSKHEYLIRYREPGSFYPPNETLKLSPDIRWYVAYNQGRPVAWVGLRLLAGHESVGLFCADHVDDDAEEPEQLYRMLFDMRYNYCRAINCKTMSGSAGEKSLSLYAQYGFTLGENGLMTLVTTPAAEEKCLTNA